MDSLQFPGGRNTALCGLEFFAERESVSDEWPDLTNAVHWLIDDMWWDQHSPSGDIGVVLWDENEAKAVGAVVAGVLEILHDQDLMAPDSEYFDDPRSTAVRAAAIPALALMQANDAAHAGSA